MAPDFTLETRDGRPATEIGLYRYRSGGAILLALLREVDSGSSGGRVTLKLERPYLVRDVRAGRALGRVDRLPLTLAATEPTILALFGTPALRPEMAVPERRTRGEEGWPSVRLPSAERAR